MLETPPPAMPDDAAARGWITRLGMAPHPEGGWYVETWRDGSAQGELGARGHGTAIYYLLAAGQRSHWHRVDAAEIWHFYAGATLELGLADGDDAQPRVRRLGVGAEDHPQIIVPPGVWQAARSLGGWTLVGCTVSPGFTFGGFELAPPGWSPGPR